MTLVMTSGPLAEPMQSYAAKVRDESYRVTDADVAELRAAGLSEDEVFEITVAAALGAGVAVATDAKARAELLERITGTGNPSHAPPPTDDHPHGRRGLTEAPTDARSRPERRPIL